MSTLRELIPLQDYTLESDTSQLRPGILSKFGGVFQRADTKNANQRVYPLKLWQDILSSPDVKERIENRRMLGMLGHPEAGSTDMEKSAIVVTKQALRSDNSIYGEAEVLDTPSGRIADTLLRAGVGLGISSRGDGSVEKKGDQLEVKDDFKLETYDLVLKPSTPGAYPEMLSECTVEEHEKLVVSAIEGLVKSKLPEQQRLLVLSECLEILNALEATDSDSLVTTLSTQITEQLRSTVAQSSTPDVVTSIEANEDVSQTSSQHQTEDLMKGSDQNNAPSLSEDTLRWHQNEVSAAKEEVAQVKEQEISKLKDSFVEAQRTHNETVKRLKAAESLIEDFVAEIKRLKTASPSNKKLARRYEAAVELLDEALKHLPQKGALARRCKTLEGLVEAGIKNIATDRKTRAIKEHLAQVHPSMHKTVRKMLERCRTPEQVAETFKALVKVSGARTKPAGDPLPEGTDPSRRKPVQESNDSSKPAKSYAELIGQRLSRAV